MVIFLSVYPLFVAAGLFVLDLLLPVELIVVMSASLVFSAALSCALLVAILIAAYRQKDNAVLMSAWLFLFCGVAILSMGSLIDPYVSAGESWIEEIFETASFFPLLFFAIYIASPLRLLIFSRRQRRLYPILGLVLLLAVFAIVFLPWLLMYEGPRLHASAKNLLRLAKPVLDTLMAEPLAFLVLAIGLSRGSSPYLLLGLGLLLFLPEDILSHFQLLSRLDPHGQISDLLSITARLYLLNGALLNAFTRRSDRTAQALTP